MVDGDVFEAKNADGLSMTFKVISASEKTCQLGVAGTTEGGDGSQCVPKDTKGQVTIPAEVNGFQVTTISSCAFYRCDQITGFTIPESVTYIGSYAFMKTAITSIYIPKNVYDMGTNIVMGCQQLEKIDIDPDNNRFLHGYNAIITNGMSLVAGCKNTVIPTTVKSIMAGAFYYVQGMPKTLELHEGLSQIDSGAFEGADMEHVVLPSTLKTILSEAFSHCNNLKTVTYYTDNPPKLHTCNYMTFYPYQATLYVPKGAKAKFEATFDWKSEFKEIVELDDPFISTVNTNGLTFDCCLGGFQATLTKVSPELTGELSLPETVESNGKPFAVTTISAKAFEACTKIEKLLLPKTLKTCEEGALSHCSSLREISVAEGNPQLYSYDGVLYEDEGAWENLIAYPPAKVRFSMKHKGQLYIEKQSMANAKLYLMADDSQYTFQLIYAVDDRAGCDISKSELYADIPARIVENNKTWKKFKRFFQSTKYTFGEGAEYYFHSEHDYNYGIIEECIFFSPANSPIGSTGIIPEYNQIETKKIPVVGISPAAFGYYADLKSVTIPKSIKTIGYGAFIGCKSLKEIRCLSVVPIALEKSADSWRSVDNPNLGAAYTPLEDVDFETCKLYVPIGSLQAYREAEGWKEFKNIEEDESIPTDVVKLAAKSYTRYYGDNNPTFGYEVVKGKITSGTPTITCEATNTSPVGTYDIVIQKGSVSNSMVELENGTLTIIKAPLVISAGDYTKEEGEENPTFTPTFSGFRNYEWYGFLTKQPTITCEATKESPAGVYPVIVSGAEAENYDITYQNGTLTIQKIAELTAKSYTRYYGDNNPTFEYSVTEGAIKSGTPIVTCSATKTSPVGTYDIIIEKGSVSNNTVKLVNGTLTITQAPLTIKTGTYTKKQGEKMPAFELTYEGFKNNETNSVLTKQPSVSCEATENSAPGEYTVTVFGAEAKNYDITHENGKLIVTDADPVTITAKSYTREYGEENPTFDYEVSGAQLDGEPVVECEATESSTVGTYDIIIKKGSVKNYNDTYVNGTLTITKAPLTVTAKDSEREEGEENPDFEISYKGWKLQDTESVLLKKPIATTTATKDSPVGDYDIVVSGGEAQNYELNYVNGKLTVTVPSDIGKLTSSKLFDVYDTQGRKVRSQTTILKDLPKGVYIVNGRKQVVK